MAAAAKGPKSTGQRWRVRFVRNAIAHSTRAQRPRVSAAIGNVCVLGSLKTARGQWRDVSR